MKTYSLESAVLQICGPDSGMKDPRGWLLRQIRAGRFQARKIGRHYRMTEEQISAAIKAVTADAVEPKPSTPAPKPHGLSLTATSARRLKSVAP